jgi:PAS domain S-box-containing protein
MYGYPYDEMIGLSGTDFIHPDYHYLFKQFVEETPSGKPFAAESVEIRKDGSTFNIEVRGSTFEYEGEPHILAIIRDVTKRKRTEEALRESEEQLKTLINAMPDFICFKDGEGCWLKVNDAGIRIFQLEGIDYRGKKDSELAELSSRLQGAFLTCKESDAMAWNKGGLFHGEEMISHPDGTVRFYDVAKVPVFHPDGGRKGIVVLGHDITEQKRTEEKEKESIKNIRLLYESAIRFVEFPPDKDIYSYIGDQILELAGKDTIVTVNSNDMENRILTVRALSGAGGFVTKIAKLMGTHPVGMTFNAGDEDFDYLSDGKLHLYKEGLYGILLKTIPKTVCVAIEKLMNTDKIYTIGFIKENQIFGTVVIFMPKGAADLTNREIIETFIKQASIVIQRRQVEEALRESEEQFRLLAENSIDCIWMLDTRLRFTYLSPSVETILGYKPEQLVGTKLSSYFRKKEFFKVGALAAKAIKNYKTFTHVTFETRMLNSKNEKVDIEITSKMLLNDQGKLIGLQGTTRDITERRKAEESLRESEEKFRSMSSAAQDAIIMIEENGKVVLWNNSAERILGYTHEEILGREFHAVLAPSHYKEAYTKGINKFRKTGQGPAVGKTIELEAVRKDGTEIPVELSLSAVMLSGRWCAIGILRDITDRKRAEEEKARIEDQYRQAQKMESVGRLAGGVAHDFNNMLGVILGYTDMSLEKIDPAQPVYAALQEIRKAADRSADLTRQLLAFARSQTVSPRVLDLNETLEGMLKMLHRLIGEDIDLVWLPGNGLWPVKVDPVQIDQVLANLCVNSRDAIAGVGKMTIETGKVVLDKSFCREHPGSVPGEYVLLTVSDNGCGMDKETLDNLFEPFFTTKEVGQGTGLGLATVYGIVKQNNGYIYVKSEPDEGTIFRIYLPRHVGKAAQMQKKDLAEPAKRGHETILLVEDEPAILKMATTMLERQGYNVLNAATPDEAIRLAGEYDSEIHLLITDVVMPKMNGLDLAKSISLLYPDIRQLFMSGYTANVIAHRRVLDEGVNFIQKPFSMQDLAAKVREVLDSE